MRKRWLLLGLVLIANYNVISIPEAMSSHRVNGVVLEVSDTIRIRLSAANAAPVGSNQSTCNSELANTQRKMFIVTATRTECNHLDAFIRMNKSMPERDVFDLIIEKGIKKFESKPYGYYLPVQIKRGAIRGPSQNYNLSLHLSFSQFLVEKMQAIQLKVSLITRRHVSASEVIRFLMGLALIDGESESVSIQNSPDEVYQEALVAASVQEDAQNAVSTQVANRLTEINARIGAPMYIAPQLLPVQAGDNVNIGYTVNSSLEPSTAESNLGARYNQKKIQKSSLSVAMKEELVRTIQRLAQSNHMDLEEFFTRLLLDGEQLVNSAPLGQFEPIDNEMGRTGVSWNVPIKLSTSFVERLNHLHNQYVLYYKKPIHRTTIVRLLIRLALMKYLPTGLPEHGDKQ